MIRHFSEIGRGDLEHVGGKGAGLGEAMRAGIPLPDGFVLEAAAYRAFVDEARLAPKIAAALAGSDVQIGEAEACERASDKIRAAFVAAPFPTQLEKPLSEALDRIHVGEHDAVAVRSSATAEDLPEASFAGQQETFLAVCGLTEIFARVRDCWSSLWTGRAISYRSRQGFGNVEVALAVVVQQMVEPEVAGVLFTVNPVNGRADEMLLNASYGLGEAVVSGQVTPDTWRLARSGWRWKRDFQLGTKERLIRSSPDGGTITEAVFEPLRVRPCLDNASLKALKAMGERAESWFGGPQDIEFAWAGGQLFLLQSRPVTTSVSATRRLSGIQRRTLDDLLEHYPSPPVPLDERPVVEGYEQLHAMGRDFGIRLPHARDVICMDQDGVFRLHPPSPRPTWRILKAPWLISRRLRVRPKDWLHRLGPILEERPAILGEDPVDLGDRALGQRVSRALELAERTARVRFADVILPMSVRGFWLSTLARLARRPADALEWLEGLKYKTVEIEWALQDLADKVMEDSALQAVYDEVSVEEIPDALIRVPGGAEYLGQVEALLCKHGARTGTAYVPFSSRSWREEPSPVHLGVAAMVKAGGRDAAQARTATALARHELRRDAVRNRLPRFLRPSFERTLGLYREAHVARESTLYAIEESFGAARRAMDEIARRLVDRGWLAELEHIRFARVEEVVAALTGEFAVDDFRRVIFRRRARRDGAVVTWRAQRPPPELRGNSALKGIGSSPGIASGPVRIIHGTRDFGRLNSGDVLVCPHTDPTWTPLFGLAAAVVSDTGGPLSHAAIVAREYGIPAVLGVEVGTQILEDGLRVIVDGGSGEVQREEAECPDR